MSKNIILTSHSDSGHGWLAIKRDVLVELGILEKISHCSYQSKSGKTVYLEEDADASLLINECKKKGYEFTLIKGKYYERSPIRNYNCFQL